MRAFTTMPRALPGRPTEDCGFYLSMASALSIPGIFLGTDSHRRYTLNKSRQTGRPTIRLSLARKV